MSNIEFQESVVEKIEGWLHRVTSLRTMDILSYQESSEIEGPILEIGVYHGKYFSVLARSAQKMGDRLLGIDTFQWKSEAEVMASLALSPETDRAKVDLWKCFSTECTPQGIISRMGGRARFISIDGSHDAPDVLLDLEMCEQILAPKGIIAADDFINPVAIGVNEGVHLFFAKPRKVVPVAYIDNKLFLAHRAHAGYYRYTIEQAILHDEMEPASKSFRERAATARNLVEQKLWGESVITCF